MRSNMLNMLKTFSASRFRLSGVALGMLFLVLNSKLADLNLQERSPRLWAFLGALYWVSLVTYFLLWKAYKHVTEIRATALMSSEVKAEQFAVLVRDIPTPKNGETRKEQVDSYFRDIYPDTFYKSLIVTDNKKVRSQFEFLAVLIKQA